MHPVQAQLLELSKTRNLAQMSLRDMAKAIGMPDESPQKIKHHILQLQKKGFIKINRSKGLMERTITGHEGLAKGLLAAKQAVNQLFVIPIIGVASCGPATIFAEENFEGFLRVSRKLVGRPKPTGLYAIKADGSSMNRAEVNGKNIENGDYVIVDSNLNHATTNDIVLAIVDGKGVIKRFVDDREKNDQVVLTADSSFDYQPIHIHEDDDFSISGRVVGVIKQPV